MKSALNQLQLYINHKYCLFSCVIFSLMKYFNLQKKEQQKPFAMIPESVLYLPFTRLREHFFKIPTTI